MKCADCPKWDKKDADCLATEDELEGECLIKHILWQLQFIGGLIEENQSDDDDSEWWKSD